MITLTANSNEILKLPQGGLTLTRSYGKDRLLVDSLDAVGSWTNEFDTDNEEVIETTIIKEGTGSLKSVTELSGRLFSVIDDCETLDNITNVTAAQFSLNTTTFKTGTSAINVTKFTSASNCGFQFNFSSQDMNDSTRKFCFWLYIKDQTTLDKITSMVIYTNDGTAGFDRWSTVDNGQITAPSVGWNFYRITPNIAEDTEGGGADESALTSMRIRLYTDVGGDTWSEGDVIIDYFHRRSQSGYGSILDRSFNKDWSGHSLTDRIGFWLYISDKTKFAGDLEISFGDAVAGGVQAKVTYDFVNSRLQTGWNWVSVELGEFVVAGAYTLDLSNIAQFRLTTNYVTSTTSYTQQYDPDETIDIYLDYLTIEKNNYLEVLQ